VGSGGPGQGLTADEGMELLFGMNVSFVCWKDHFRAIAVRPLTLEYESDFCRED
jgi:hypothetical protein